MTTANPIIYDVLYSVKLSLDIYVFERDYDALIHAGYKYVIAKMLLSVYDKDSLEVLRKEIINYCHSIGLSKWDIEFVIGEDL
jgi:hypothetical protein